MKLKQVAFWLCRRPPSLASCRLQQRNWVARVADGSRTAAVGEEQLIGQPAKDPP